MQINDYIIERQGTGFMFDITDFTEQIDLFKYDNFKPINATFESIKDLKLSELFDTILFRRMVIENLPEFFQIAEIEHTKGGTVGMGVGLEREKILISLLIDNFGRDIVDTNIPINEAEKDALLNKDPLSIKTKTGHYLNGVKLIWTTDAEQVGYFKENYYPSCDMLFAQIVWNDKGGLFLIDVSTQEEIFNDMGRGNYMKLPKPGNNSRGVEFTSKALDRMLWHKDTKFIEIKWKRRDLNHDPYERWTKIWKQRRRKL